jgi:hypothetical protein
MQGITDFITPQKVRVVQIHYSADPDKRSQEWIDKAHEGMSKAMWEKEMEINFAVVLGKAWFPEFRKGFHVAQSHIEPISGRPVFRGWDYGLTPATVFGQTTAKGQLLILNPELQSWDNGITAHGLVVQTESATYFPGYKFIDYGDPAGNQRAQTDEQSCNDILRDKYGINVQPGPVAEMARHEALRTLLTTLTPDGQPMMLIDPRCTLLIQALEGGYQHKEVAGKYLDIVADNKYTHIMDALMYVAAMVKVKPKKWEDANIPRAGRM